jgi:hypothetical protein
MCLKFQTNLLLFFTSNISQASVPVTIQVRPVRANRG